MSEAKLRFQSRLAIPCLQAAAHFAGLARSVELDHEGEELSAFYDQIRWYSLSSVIQAVTSLEANINEWFLDAEYLTDLDDEGRSAVVKMLDKESLLERYQTALLLTGATKFSERSDPFQSVQILIRLRNSLVHFRPEWSDDQEDHEKLGKQLRGRFTLSPFFPDSSPVFPDRCMSGDLGKWAATAVLQFIQSFHLQSGTKTRFTEHFVATIDRELAIFENNS